MKSGDFEKIVQKMTLKPQFWNLFDFCGYGVFAGIWGLCHSWQVWQHPDQFEEGLLEGVAAGEVDEEVHRGVEHQSQVVEAGEAEDPQRRRHLFIVAAIPFSISTLSRLNWCSPYYILAAEELVAVDEDSGDIAEEEDDNNTDEDWGKVQLLLGRASRPFSRKPENYRSPWMLAL